MNRIYNGYERYKEAQIAVNRAKAHIIWATKQELQHIAAHLLLHIHRPRFGLCHGVRTGWEIDALSKYLECPVVGTDISPDNVGKMVVCHDMHEVLDDCRNACSFVYSNSFDHCYDLAKFLQAQKQHLTLNGWLYLTHSKDKLVATDEADCLGITLSELKAICQNHFSTVETIPIGSVYNPSFGQNIDGLEVVCCRQ